MRTTLNVCLVIVRIAGLLQLVGGLLFWAGYALTYIPLHMAIGSILVLALWAIAAAAFMKRTRRAFALFVFVWGPALAAFGAMQSRVLIGPNHWVIRLVHLLMGAIAMGTGMALAKSLLAPAPTAAPTSTLGRAAATASQSR
jgi:hypothetical protein